MGQKSNSSDNALSRSVLTMLWLGVYIAKRCQLCFCSAVVTMRLAVLSEEAAEVMGVVTDGGVVGDKITMTA